MRADVVRVLVLASPLTTLGCVEGAGHDPWDPGEIAREEARVDRVAPPSRASSRTVRCACDADGDLHVRAPAGSRVTRPEDATYDAEAEIVLPEGTERRPIRRTVSLGFIGDGKLTQGPLRGPWAPHDSLLPPHGHGFGSYSSSRSYGYSSFSTYQSFGVPTPAPVAPGNPWLR